MKGNVLVGDLLAHDLINGNMVNIKAKISGHQQLCILLLRLAAHRDERDLLSDIGQRVRNGFTGLNIDRSNNVRAGDIRLAILPDDVVLILEPVLEFLITAVHCDCAPVIASRIIVVFHSDRAAAQLVAAELRQQFRDNILPCLFCLTHALSVPAITVSRVFLPSSAMPA